MKKIFAVILLLHTFLFICAGCSGQDHQPDRSSNKTNMNQMQYTWLALGDSYTIGESVNERDRFVAQTIRMLQTAGVNFSEPHYIATTGWTTQDLLNAIRVTKPQGPFDVVTLLIGVNDQYQHMDTAGYRERFTECLQQAIALAGGKTGHVFVLSIPDYSVTPFATSSNISEIQKEIDEFNAINKAITLSYNISYTDITPLTRRAKIDVSLVAADGLHPSAKEYAAWAPLLVQEIEKVLR